MLKKKSVAAWVLLLVLAGCGGGGGSGGSDGSDGDDHNAASVPAASKDMVVFAWNDLGMHCLNPTYDSAVILPPYNTIWAQVVRRGNPPQIITTGITVEYGIKNNTTSQKTATSPHAMDFRQFWENDLTLFGVDLALDTGLNLKDPATHNGLSGQMALFGDHYEAVGVPVTPLDDDLVWNPYQIARITVKDGSGNILAQTEATVPVSDEINCTRCHGRIIPPFITVHNQNLGTNLPADAPFLCAQCHASPALGTPDRIGNIPYLSEAIHLFHGANPPDRRPACYDCHPGTVTQCNRSLRHTATGGNCETCHGVLATVGASIRAGRVPWATEPKCADCHDAAAIPEIDTGVDLYRNAKGHGGMACPACHGSPHAMIPSREESDNNLAKQHQSVAVSIGSCGVCHDSSRGHSPEDFDENHGPSGEHDSACKVCHTEVSAQTDLWPHKFKWKAR